MAEQFKFLVILSLLTILNPNDVNCCDPGRHPYHLHLSNSCGASLLTPRYGLTSGFCCETSGLLRASSGYRRQRDYEEYDQEHEVIQKILHPQHIGGDGNKFQHDYCLLKFDGAFQMNKRTSMIALATKEDTKHLFRDTSSVQFFGYGGDIFKSSVENKTLAENAETKTGFDCVNISIPNQKGCSEKATTYGISFNSDSQICVLDEGHSKKLQDVVDIGAPITYRNLQFGIISSVRDITLIARVDYAYDWIDKYKTANQGLKSLSKAPSLASTTRNNIIVAVFLFFIHEYFVSCMKCNWFG